MKHPNTSPAKGTDYQNKISHHTTTNEPEKNESINKTNRTQQNKNNTTLHSQLSNKQNKKELKPWSFVKQNFDESNETVNTQDQIKSTIYTKTDFKKTNIPVNLQKTNSIIINHDQTSSRINVTKYSNTKT